MTGLPREVLKWLQHINLSTSVQTPHWDLRNGYLVGKIINTYYPKLLPIFTDDSDVKRFKRNWQLIKRALNRMGVKIPDCLIDGVMFGKVGASSMLLNRLYTQLTNKPLILKECQRPDSNFVDIGYQNTLPLYARNNISASLRTNFPDAERSIYDELLTRKKSYDIIGRYKCFKASQKTGCERAFKMPSIQEQVCRLTPPTSLVFLPIDATETC